MGKKKLFSDFYTHMCHHTHTHTHTHTRYAHVVPSVSPLFLTAAIIAGAIVGILLLFILVGLLIVFLKRR
jgi:hypothetical protein